MSKMKLLVVGHSLVIDANRKFWSAFSANTDAEVDLVAPMEWSSNLSQKICFSPSPSTDSHLRKIFPIKVLNKGNGSLFFFRLLPLWRVLMKRKYDAIYLNQETWALATLGTIIVKLLSKNAKTPLFLGVAQNLKKEKYRLLHRYERLISKFVHAFMYCSEEVKEVLRWKGINSSCIYFPLPFDDKSYFPRILAYPVENFSLGYLGRLTEDKGLLVLLKVLDELNRDGVHYSLVLGGSGPLLNELLARPYVRYEGLIPHNQAQEFYKKIDCFVLPSQTRPHWKEQFGRVIVEALAAGVPVIGSSSGSIPEVLAKVGWPWIFQEDSPEELRQMILKMRAHLQDEQGRTELKKAVDLNKELFSQSEVAKNLFKHFQSRPSSCP